MSAEEAAPGATGPGVAAGGGAQDGPGAAPPAAPVGGGDVTKVIYHVGEEETPYMVKVPAAPSRVTLGDLKAVLKRPGFKFFFKAKDDDCGIVKEEITDDAMPLPLFNGKVECYLELSQAGSVVGGASNAGSSSGAMGRLSSLQHRGGGGARHRGGGPDDAKSLATTTDGSAASDSVAMPPPGLERGPGVGETRPPSFHGGVNAAAGLAYPEETDSLLSSRPEMPPDDFDDTESSITSVSVAADRRRRERDLRMRMGPSAAAAHSYNPNKPAPLPGPGIRPPHLQHSHRSGRHHGASGTTATNTESVLSSELESSIYDETEDGRSLASSSRLGTTDTEHTSVSQQHAHRQKRRSKRRVPAHLARAGSISTMSDSTMSLNTITVTLNMDSVSFLGISIVGQSNKFDDGDCGIYVGSIMTGGAVALDGRIAPGDMILQVNDIPFDNMTNDEAVMTLREVVQKPGPIKLVVAKCWDTSPPKSSYFTVPRAEPVRPIDPSAWVAHIEAVRDAESMYSGRHQGMNGGETASEYNYLGFFGDVQMDPSHFPSHPGIGNYPARIPSVTTLSGSSITSSQAETEKYVPIPPTAALLAQQQQLQQQQQPLTAQSPPVVVARAMQRAPASELEVKDRQWLGIPVKNAFIGSQAVDWLTAHVDGLADRKEARKFASQLLKAGHFKHLVKNSAFKEECYYTFEDNHTPSASSAGAVPPTAAMGNMSLGAAGGGPSHFQPPQSYPPPSGPAPPPPSYGGPQQHPMQSYPQQQQQQWMGPQPTAGAPQQQLLVDQSIYNPAAPPPSANYAGYGGPAAVGYGSGNDSGHSQAAGGSRRLRLAGSGSGSESDPAAGGSGKAPSTIGSDGGFRAAAANRHQQQEQLLASGTVQPAPIGGGLSSYQYVTTQPS